MHFLFGKNDLCETQMSYSSINISTKLLKVLVYFRIDINTRMAIHFSQLVMTHTVGYIHFVCNTLCDCFLITTAHSPFVSLILEIMCHNNSHNPNFVPRSGAHLQIDSHTSHKKKLQKPQQGI